MRTFLHLLRWYAHCASRFNLPGTERILRFFCHPDKSCSYSKIVAYDTDLKIHVALNSFIEWTIFFYGYYEKPVIELLKKIIPVGGITLDIGANIGSTTLIMGKYSGKNGGVFAFEPEPHNRAALQKNIAVNRMTNVRVFPVACSDTAANMPLYTHNGVTSNRGTPSLVKNNDSVESVTVETTTVDSFAATEKLKRVDLIKIDTEGYDYKVLRGARETILKYQPVIIFEFDKNRSRMIGATMRNFLSFFSEIEYALYLVTQRGLKKITTDAELRDESANILGIPKNDTRLNLPV